jgi:hypothetical protein
MKLSVHSTPPLCQDIKACHFRQNTVTDSCGQPFEMNKMLREKEVLEQGLADCVISLQTLKKKQARNERQLGKVATLSRKKQKHLQQIKRDLAREMRNRERDEQAFLFNLQACKVSIQACNTWVAYDAALSTWIDTAVTPTLCTPTLYSYSGTESTESSWYSWNGGVDMARFGRSNDSTYCSDQNEAHKGFYHDKHDPTTDPELEDPLQWSLDAGDVVLLPQVPPDTARTQWLQSKLDPEADVFQPQEIWTQHVQAPRYVRLRAKSI